MHDLDGDRAVQLEPHAAIDDAHRALREHVEDLVPLVEDRSAQIGP
jgi:hypothetical protein